MKIALLAPFEESVPPEKYGGTELVIYNLAQILVDEGHQVYLLATGDSKTKAKLIPIFPKAIRKDPLAKDMKIRDAFKYIGISRVMEELALLKPDIIHNHMYPEFLALLASFKTPLVTTIHAQMTPEMADTLKLFLEAHLVAISESAKKLSGLDIPVIHNGIDTEFFIPGNAVRDYLLFVGRMSKAKNEKGNFLDPKGVVNAIKIAQKTGDRLKIVGNVEDSAFFETLIKPHLSDKIEFVGDVSSEQLLTREQMRELFQGAKAFLFPINWEEPFGLVMAEAMACGTPVVAFNRGSVSEIVIDTKNGFVVEVSEGVDGFINKLSKLSQISSEECRKDAVTRFSKSRMADDYEKLYNEVIIR